MNNYKIIDIGGHRIKYVIDKKTRLIDTHLSRILPNNETFTFAIDRSHRFIPMEDFRKYILVCLASPLYKKKYDVDVIWSTVKMSTQILEPPENNYDTVDIVDYYATMELWQFTGFNRYKLIDGVPFLTNIRGKFDLDLSTYLWNSSPELVKKTTKMLLKNSMDPMSLRVAMIVITETFPDHVLVPFINDILTKSKDLESPAIFDKVEDFLLELKELGYTDSTAVPELKKILKLRESEQSDAEVFQKIWQRNERMMTTSLGIKDFFSRKKEGDENAIPYKLKVENVRENPFPEHGFFYDGNVYFEIDLDITAQNSGDYKNDLFALLDDLHGKFKNKKERTKDEKAMLENYGSENFAYINIINAPGYVKQMIDEYKKKHKKDHNIRSIKYA